VDLEQIEIFGICTSCSIGQSGINAGMLGSLSSGRVSTISHFDTILDFDRQTGRRTLCDNVYHAHTQWMSPDVEDVMLSSAINKCC